MLDSRCFSYGIEWLIDWLTDYFRPLLIATAIDWLIDWFACFVFCFSNFLLSSKFRAFLFFKKKFFSLKNSETFFKNFSEFFFPKIDFFAFFSHRWWRRLDCAKSGSTGCSTWTGTVSPPGWSSTRKCWVRTLKRKCRCSSSSAPSSSPRTSARRSSRTLRSDSFTSRWRMGSSTTRFTVRPRARCCWPRTPARPSTATIAKRATRPASSSTIVSYRSASWTSTKWLERRGRNVLWIGGRNIKVRIFGRLFFPPVNLTPFRTACDAAFDFSSRCRLIDWLTFSLSFDWLFDRSIDWLMCLLWL